MRNDDAIGLFRAAKNNVEALGYIIEQHREWGGTATVFTLKIPIGNAEDYKLYQWTVNDMDYSEDNRQLLQMCDTLCKLSNGGPAIHDQILQIIKYGNESVARIMDTMKFIPITRR